MFVERTCTWYPVFEFLFWLYLANFFTDCTFYALLYIKIILNCFFSTFVCPTEITAFSDRAEEFKKINTEILAASVDSQFSHLAWYIQ